MSSNKPITVSRRHFLAGLGGFTLAIPFLSSLERPARGAPAAARPNYFYLGTDHGGCWDSNFFPTTTPSSQAVVVPGHTVTAGPLAASTAGGKTTLSPVLSAAATTLTAKLVGKMNVLRGLDVPWYISHNTGQHLGNFARNDNNGRDGTTVSGLGMRPTIDQLMASSPEFYAAGDLASTTLRSMVINSGRALSWAFAAPAQGVQSAVQSVQGINSSLQLFNSIFGGKAVSSQPTRPPVVDKVLASYNSLMQSNSRLSAADKQRLQTHMAMLAQVQSSLNAQVACTTPSTPGDDAGNHAGQTSVADTTAWGKLWMDVVATAFACGASRIGVFGFGDASGFSAYSGSDWHHDVAHQWNVDSQQAFITQAYQGVFENVFAYLAAKLDALDAGNGQTVLDSSLLVWSQECCMETHASYGVPVVTFGSGAGYFNTGLACDYRNTAESQAVISPVKDYGATSTNATLNNYVTYPGLLYEQWLATQLQGMRVPASEFELWKDGSGNVQHGYGTPFVGTYDESATSPLPTHYQSVSSSYFQIASNPLPFLRK